MNVQGFESVWDAIEKTPEEAENMKLRSNLMMALHRHVDRLRLSQAQAAKQFGVTQPRVADLINGKIHSFSLDALLNMATRAGLHVELHLVEPA